MPDGSILVLQLPRPGEPELATMAGMAAPRPLDALRKPLAALPGHPLPADPDQGEPGQGLPQPPIEGELLPGIGNRPNWPDWLDLYRDRPAVVDGNLYQADERFGGAMPDTSAGAVPLQQPARWTYQIDPVSGMSVASYPGEVESAPGGTTGTGVTVLQTGPTIITPIITNGMFVSGGGTISGYGIVNGPFTVNSGVVTVPLGTAAAPSIGPPAIPGSGIFFGAAGQIAFSQTPGNQVAWFNGGGLVFQASFNLSFTNGGMVGSITGNNAIAGNVGEFISVSPPQAGVTSNVYTVLGSATLPAGDWDMFGVIEVSPQPGATCTAIQAGPSSSATTFATYQYTVLPYATSSPGVPTFTTFPTQRIVSNAATVVQLAVLISFTGGNCLVAGTLSARRRR